jgi:serine/threonine protein kinase
LFEFCEFVRCIFFFRFAAVIMHIHRTMLMHCDDDISTLRDRYARLGTAAPSVSPTHSPRALLPVPGSMELGMFLARFRRSLQPSARRSIAAFLVSAVRELHEEQLDGGASASVAGAGEAAGGAPGSGLVHCAIQPNRFVLLKPMSDEWRLMVDAELTAPKGGELVADALDPRLHALRYQAPELVLGQVKVASYAQDVYSLGLVLFEVLAGAPLFQTDAEAVAAYREMARPEVRLTLPWPNSTFSRVVF